ncbi:MAG: photosystem II stability/assembly factor-like uncharacterized protein [Saprospiraceae bacterium]|jgi:photosystem II stability/assembly factor-like uncharacterized protein
MTSVDSIISTIGYFKSAENNTLSRFSISKDLGVTWEQHIFNEYITTAEIIDDDTWLVAGENDICRTQDGSINWESIYKFYGAEQLIKYMIFSDSQNGFAATRIILFRTVDGGVIWGCGELCQKGLR